MENFHLDIDKIKNLFEKYNVRISVCHLKKCFEADNLPLPLQKYLTLVNLPIKLNITPHGSALTYLMAQKEIEEIYKDESFISCIEHNYLIIGNGLNGDWLCVNIKSGKVGYAFHDDLLEGFDDFDDIYIELPCYLDEFLDMAFTRDDYPFDGYMAEDFMKSTAD